jgi:hypothetical protein
VDFWPCTTPNSELNKPVCHFFLWCNILVWVVLFLICFCMTKVFRVNLLGSLKFHRGLHILPGDVTVHQLCDAFVRCVTTEQGFPWLLWRSANA